MKLPLIGFVLRRVRTSLWQLLWSHLLTAGAMAVTLFVFGCFMLLQINLEQLLRGWGEQIQVAAYLRKSLDPSEVPALVQRVKAYPEVAGVRLISQDEAWRDFQTALGNQSGLLDGLPHDLLPASLEITLGPANRDGTAVEQLVQRLNQESVIANVDYPQEWVERLGLIILAVQWVKWTLGGLLFLATFFIVGSVVRLALLARQDEVEIMQLVGASEDLIQAPFVLEGMIQGLTGAAIAIALLWGGFLFLSNQLPTLAGVLAPLMRPRFLTLANVGLLLAIGWLLGAAGSLFSLRRFIRTWKVSRHAA